MRIVLVVPSFPKLSESFIVGKFLQLLDSGWDVHVVCDKSDPREWSRFPNLRERSEASSRVHANWSHSPAWLPVLAFPLAFLHVLVSNPSGLLRYLRRGFARFGPGLLKRFYLDARVLALRPDAVHFEFGALAVGRMHLRNMLGSKIFVSFRGYDLNRAGLEVAGYYKEVWEQGDAFHFLGSALLKRAAVRGMPSNKSHVLIPPAIDSTFFSPRQSNIPTKAASDEIRFLSVGRLTWEKGYEHAFSGMKLLKDRELRFRWVIVGDGPMFDGLCFHRHRLGLTDEIELVGALDRARILELMRSTDLFVHNSVSEGFCNAVLEAQSCGLPVVTSDAGGLPENIVDGVTGLLVPRRDPMALADALERLAKDPILRAEMGKEGRSRVLKNFQLADQTRRFEFWYRGSLASGTAT